MPTPPSDSRSHSTPGQHVLGTAILFLGAALLFLCLIENSTGIPLNLPRFWYVNQKLWFAIAAAMLVGGTALLRQRTYRADNWQPDRPGVRFERLALYTRNGCHLCDHARDVLFKYRNYLPTIDEVDIDADPSLVEQFGTCVPVVEIDGKVRFRGRVEEILLRRLIEGTPPR